MRTVLLLLLFLPSVLGAQAPETQTADAQASGDLEQIFKLLDGPRSEGIAHLQNDWHDGYAPMLLEIVVLARDPAFARQAIDLMGEKTGQAYGYDLDSWYQWIWNREPNDHPQYAEFKAQLYKRIDPRFERYFTQATNPKIRLDEVRWGGVVQDGIPPLRGPKMISAAEATYLEDDHIVFGVEIDGDVRAYPKRILAWHEMFVDVVGGVPVAGAYCTLCGSVIVWETSAGEGAEPHALGTSGFLYRSNKLMYDQATQSLWSTLRGTPVIGPLADKGIELKMHPVVTTRWGAWKKRHPNTTVLSLDTGHQRDYSEGAAYREYFATDRLMFAVPENDQRLKNKDEVLAIVLPEHPDAPTAFSSDFLQKNPLHVERIGEVDVLVLTDKSGAHRAYRLGEVQTKKWNRQDRFVDADGGKWTMTEDALIAEDGRRLERVAAHRAFWFGWRAAFPETRLVQ